MVNVDKFLSKFRRNQFITTNKITSYLTQEQKFLVLVDHDKKIKMFPQINVTTIHLNMCGTSYVPHTLRRFFKQLIRINSQACLFLELRVSYGCEFLTQNLNFALRVLNKTLIIDSYYRQFCPYFCFVFFVCWYIETIFSFFNRQTQTKKQLLVDIRPALKFRFFLIFLLFS